MYVQNVDITKVEKLLQNRFYFAMKRTCVKHVLFLIIYSKIHLSFNITKLNIVFKNWYKKKTTIIEKTGMTYRREFGMIGQRRKLILEMYPRGWRDRIRNPAGRYYRCVGSNPTISANGYLFFYKMPYVLEIRHFYIFVAIIFT